jgi:hypothetical protein
VSERDDTAQEDTTMPLILIVLAILTWFAATPAAQAPPSGRNSAATIIGAFADSCRDFAARSSKDISHVDLHYVSGLVIKDESITRPDYSIDGGAGDELAFAIVKSGTTSEQFECEASNAAPTALLEIKTPSFDQSPPGCFEFWAGGLVCDVSIPRTVWTNNSQVPNTGGNDSGLFHWGCGTFTDVSQCPVTVSFRGIGSRDPDADITSWSLDFGDGTSTSGSWSTTPPTEITHEYTSPCIGVFQSLAGVCTVTLTVTDSAGQSDSDLIAMVFLDLRPDIAAQMFEAQLHW